MAKYPWNCSWWLFQILMFDILALEDIYICHTFTWTAPVENKGLHGLGQGRACKTLGFRFKEKRKGTWNSAWCVVSQKQKGRGVVSRWQCDNRRCVMFSSTCEFGGFLNTTHAKCHPVVQSAFRSPKTFEQATASFVSPSLGVPRSAAALGLYKLS